MIKAILVAAGQSKRLKGENKLTQKFKNKPLINHAINSLIKRVEEKKIEEVILATSATIEGQTTAFYIQDSLHSTGVKITKLAQGLPIGGEIESLDDGTLISAFKNRRDLKIKNS